LQEANHEKLVERVDECGRKGEQRDPQNRQLQDPDSPDPVREDSGGPPPTAVPANAAVAR
jgi:hypothetical protein